MIRARLRRAGRTKILAPAKLPALRLWHTKKPLFAE